MKRTIRGLALLAALALAATLLIVGISSSDGPSDETAPPTTTTATQTDTQPPLPAGPTPSNVKTAIFERAFSECASYTADRLSAKYKVVDTSEDKVSLAVGIAWTRYFKGGQDSVSEGRAGCLQGFARG